MPLEFPLDIGGTCTFCTSVGIVYLSHPAGPVTGGSHSQIRDLLGGVRLFFEPVDYSSWKRLGCDRRLMLPGLCSLPAACSHFQARNRFSCAISNPAGAARTCDSSNDCTQCRVQEGLCSCHRGCTPSKHCMSRRKFTCHGTGGMQRSA